MPRENRQTSNRELFRAVNDRIAELASQFGEERYAFVCECSRLGCTEQIHVPLNAYATVTETPRAYLVLAGHQDKDEETIVDYGSYLIVRG